MSLKKSIYSTLACPLAKEIVDAHKRVNNPFFDRDHESMLALLILYQVLEKDITEGDDIVHGIQNMLENIQNLEEFHTVLVKVNNKELNKFYKNSSYCVTYEEIQKDKEKNEWLRKPFNTSLYGVKDIVNSYIRSLKL